MAKHITLNIRSNEGYSADQVIDKTITLGALLEALQEAIEEHGEDTPVILNEGQRYGANYGFLSQYEELFTVEPEYCTTCEYELDYEGQSLCPQCGNEVE